MIADQVLEKKSWHYGLNEKLAPFVQWGADTGLESATSHGFELAIGQLSSYPTLLGVHKAERERMVDSTTQTSWQNEAALRRVGQCHASGVLLRIAALFALVAVLFLGPFAGQAQAHGLHAGVTAQASAKWAETTLSQDEAEAVSAQTGCGVNCCSATGCAAAVLNAAHPGIVVVAIEDRFALPGQTTPKPSLQTTLKRPPRA